MTQSGLKAIHKLRDGLYIYYFHQKEDPVTSAENLPLIFLQAKQQSFTCCGPSLRLTRRVQADCIRVVVKRKQLNFTIPLLRLQVSCLFVVAPAGQLSNHNPKTQVPKYLHMISNRTLPVNQLISFPVLLISLLDKSNAALVHPGSHLCHREEAAPKHIF